MKRTSRFFHFLACNGKEKKGHGKFKQKNEINMKILGTKIMKRPTKTVNGNRSYRKTPDLYN